MPAVQDYGSVGFILPTARPLDLDELAYSLYEGDHLSEDGKTLLRFQQIQVIRDGKKVHFLRSLGPAQDFLTGPLLIPALEACSVGKVMEYADYLRLDKGLDQAMADHAGEINVIEAAIQQREMTREYARRNRRTYARLLEDLK